MPQYWASYGRNGFLGSFNAAESFSRGDTVVVESPRGQELAAILNESDERFSPADTTSGTIQRLASAEDLQLSEKVQQRASQFLSDASTLAASLPVLVADAEMLLDERTLILHVMPWDEVELTTWVEDLSRRFGLGVQLLNLAELPREKLDAAKGCGKPGCGDKGGGGGCGDCGTGGGCSTGSCSKGSVKSAEELTAYFSGLRQAMEKRTSLV